MFLDERRGTALQYRSGERLKKRRRTYRAVVEANATLRALWAPYNALDEALYAAAVPIFCREFRRGLMAPDSCLSDLAGGREPEICSNLNR